MAIIEIFDFALIFSCCLSTIKNCYFLSSYLYVEMFQDAGGFRVKDHHRFLTFDPVFSIPSNVVERSHSRVR